MPPPCPCTRVYTSSLCHWLVQAIREMCIVQGHTRKRPHQRRGASQSSSCDDTLRYKDMVIFSTLQPLLQSIFASIMFFHLHLYCINSRDLPVVCFLCHFLTTPIGNTIRTELHAASYLAVVHFKLNCGTLQPKVYHTSS